MSRKTTRLDAKKVNSELLTLTYGALVSQMIKDIENIDDVNKQLERMGYNMGIRLIEDFLARTSSGRCMDLRDTAAKIQQGFKLYLGMEPTVSFHPGDEFSLVWKQCPISEWVELPPDVRDLKYCNLLCGALRGALEMVHLEIQAWFVQDQLLGHPVTELKVKYIRRLEDAAPAGED